MARAHRLLLGALVAVATLAAAATTPPQFMGRRPFPDSRDPPSYADLPEPARAAVDLGHAVFNTPFVAAGTVGAERRDGVGPIFIAAACDACHNEGAHGRGPTGDGPVAASLVVQLGSTRNAGAGDPVYGHVFGTSALPGVLPEGVVRVRYGKRDGRYADGTPWRLRVPHYELTDLNYGPLDAHTVVKPRLAPAVFGVGLLEAVPSEALCGTPTCLRTGRFGWQGGATSVRDQTTKALAREMGLTSTDVAADDCTDAQRACRAQPNGGVPEVADELLDALLEFQRWLAVPERRPFPDDRGAAQRTFGTLGCAACHRPVLPVGGTAPAAARYAGSIDAFTDLQLHDLGAGLADLTVGGQSVQSRWRTAPLWGRGYRISREREPTFLHDGRARSVEEAILWHGGDAGRARANFLALPAETRTALLRWVESL